MIDTIIFDAEGVIIDTHPLWQQADIEFLLSKKVTFDLEAIHSKIVGSSILDGSRIMKEMLDLPGRPEDLANERFKIIEHLFKNEIHFIPGFLDFFNKINNHYKVAVGTSIKKELMAAVNSKLNLEKLFNSQIYHISDVGNLSKPHPAIFLHAAEKLNSLPETCVVIEDAPNGIRSAKKANMKCIGITTTFSAEKLKDADMVVNNYSEINLNNL